MLDSHTFFGALAVLIGVVSYAPYYRDVFAGKTKPHPFTWALWLLMDTTAFIAQFLNGAGPGAWATGITVLLASGIVVLSLRYGEKRIVSLDKWFFTAGLLGIGLWVLTSNALYAVIIAAATNVAATIPALRKSYLRPHEETLSLFVLAIFKWIPAMLALESFTMTTWLYPAVIVLTNSVFISIVLYRRRALRIAA